MLDKETQKLIKKYKIQTIKRITGSLIKYEVNGTPLKDLEFPPEDKNSDVYDKKPSATEIIRLINKFLTDNNLPDANIYMSGDDDYYPDVLYVYANISRTEEEILSDLHKAIQLEDQDRKDKLAEKEAKRKNKEEEELRQLEELKAKYERLSTS